MELISIKPENVERAANMLKAVAHPVRMSIIAYLDEGAQRTVTEIHKKLGIDQSTASHHLGIMKDKGVLDSRREGRNTLYFLKYSKFTTILQCMDECCK